MFPTNLSEADLLRVQLAEAKLKIAFVEKEALLERICRQYSIDPDNAVLDLSTGDIVRK